MNAYYTQITHPNRNRRRRHMMGCSGAALLLLLATTSNNIVHAHTNFFCTTWGDASTNCVDQHPCPLGTDEECNSGAFLIVLIYAL
mmetsp:Transcript_17098/g.27799  ORF Transcript_17098/g.27799 Transcript_17098/m.27799 type:complete len:86 (-) Transcript_17098:1135-1392(-)